MATFKCLKVGLLIVFVSITAIVERSEGTATADWFESVSGITFARGNVNFALGKPTNQSSTRLNASFAVDGVRTNKPHKCSRTERAKESWWKVDLLDEYIIDFLRIFHSTKFDITGVTISTSRDDVTYTPCSTITQNDTVATKEILKQCDTLQVGRYVRFDKFSTGYLVICELEIYDKEPITTTPAPTTTAPPTTIPDISPTMSEEAVNFALLKRTSQSSTAGGRHSTFAVDGDETSDSKKLCSETGIDYTVWWKVDLRANYLIRFIVVTPRQGARNRVHDVILSASRNDIEYTECATIGPEDFRESTIAVKECQPALVGRFVKAEKSNSTVPLTICEFQVYDKYPFTTTVAPTTTPIETTTLDINPSPTISADHSDIIGARYFLVAVHDEDLTNFALNKPTSQSSVSGGKNSTLAVDGNKSPRSEDGSCTRTKVDETVWWKVDLRNNFIVKYIVITNRNTAKGTLIDTSMSVSLDDVHYTECGTVTEADVMKSLTIVKECDPEIVGRFVLAKRTNNTATLVLCEVEVFDQYPFTTTQPPTTTIIKTTTLAIDPSPTMSPDVSNFALNKPTSQSSVLWGKNSTLAVDGNTSPRMDNGSCTRTKVDETVWWKVDLRNNFIVRYIVITNRNVAKVDLINVSLSVSPDDVHFTECGTVTAADVKKSLTIVKECNPEIVGRFVKAERTNNTAKLTLCEVEVFDQYPFTTTRAPTTTPVRKTTLAIDASPTMSQDVSNFALDKPTWQSSVQSKRNSTLAVDGNTSSFIEDRSCSRTKNDETVWWKVDLRNNFIVRYIVITNRNVGVVTLINVTMSVSLDDIHYTECGTVTAADVFKSLTVVMECNPEIVGRFVKAERTNNTYSLTLCEVQVFDQYPFTTTRAPTTRPPTTTTIRITTAGPPTTTTQPSTMAYVSSTTSEDPFPTTMVSTTLPIETTTSRTTTSRTTTGTTTSTTSTTVLSSVLTTALSSTSALSTSSPRKVTTDVYESSIIPSEGITTTTPSEITVDASALPETTGLSTAVTTLPISSTADVTRGVTFSVPMTSDDGTTSATSSLPTSTDSTTRFVTATNERASKVTTAPATTEGSTSNVMTSQQTTNESTSSDITTMISTTDITTIVTSDPSTTTEDITSSLVSSPVTTRESTSVTTPMISTPDITTIMTSDTSTTTEDITSSLVSSPVTTRESTSVTTPMISTTHITTIVTSDTSTTTEDITSSLVSSPVTTRESTSVITPMISTTDITTIVTSDPSTTTEDITSSLVSSPVTTRESTSVTTPMISTTDITTIVTSDTSTTTEDITSSLVSSPVTTRESTSVTTPMISTTHITTIVTSDTSTTTEDITSSLVSSPVTTRETTSVITPMISTPDSTTIVTSDPSTTTEDITSSLVSSPVTTRESTSVTTPMISTPDSTTTEMSSPKTTTVEITTSLTSSQSTTADSTTSLTTPKVSTPGTGVVSTSNVPTSTEYRTTTLTSTGGGMTSESGTTQRLLTTDITTGVTSNPPTTAEETSTRMTTGQSVVPTATETWMTTSAMATEHITTTVASSNPSTEGSRTIVNSSQISSTDQRPTPRPSTTIRKRTTDMTKETVTIGDIIKNITSIQPTTMDGSTPLLTTPMTSPQISTNASSNPIATTDASPTIEDFASRVTPTNITADVVSTSLTPALPASITTPDDTYTNVTQNPSTNYDSTTRATTPIKTSVTSERSTERTEFLTSRSATTTEDNATTLPVPKTTTNDITSVVTSSLTTANGERSARMTGTMVATESVSTRLIAHSTSTDKRITSRTSIAHSSTEVSTGDTHSKTTSKSSTIGVSNTARTSSPTIRSNSTTTAVPLITFTPTGDSTNATTTTAGIQPINSTHITTHATTEKPLTRSPGSASRVAPSLLLTKVEENPWNTTKHLSPTAVISYLASNSTKKITTTLNTDFNQTTNNIPINATALIPITTSDTHTSSTADNTPATNGSIEITTLTTGNTSKSATSDASTTTENLSATKTVDTTKITTNKKQITETTVVNASTTTGITTSTTMGGSVSVSAQTPRISSQDPSDPGLTSEGKLTNSSWSIEEHTSIVSSDYPHATTAAARTETTIQRTTSVAACNDPSSDGTLSPGGDDGLEYHKFTAENSTTLVFKCKEGFGMIGKATIECVNGEWVGNVPICENKKRHQNSTQETPLQLDGSLPTQAQPQGIPYTETKNVDNLIYAVVGCIFGVVALLTTVIGFILMALLRRRKKKKEDKEEDVDNDSVKSLDGDETSSTTPIGDPANPARRNSYNVLSKGSFYEVLDLDKLENQNGNLVSNRHRPSWQWTGGLESSTSWTDPGNHLKLERKFSRVYDTDV